MFVHAVAPGPAARLVAQHDGLPDAGAAPTDRWRPGAIVRDRQPLVLPPGPAAGDSCRLLVGWYERDTLRRLPATDGTADSPTTSDTVELGSVAGPGCGP